MLLAVPLVGTVRETRPAQRCHGTGWAASHQTAGREAEVVARKSVERCVVRGFV